MRYSVDINTKMGKIHSELINVKGSGWMPLPALVYADGTAKTLTTESPEQAALELEKTICREELVEVLPIPAMPDLVVLSCRIAENENEVATEMLGFHVYGNVAVLPKDMLKR